MTIDKPLSFAEAPVDAYMGALNCVNRYCAMYDFRRLDLLEEVFHSDATLDVQPNISPEVPAVGIDAIRSFFEAIEEADGDSQRRHTMTNLVITDYTPSELRSLVYMTEFLVVSPDEQVPKTLLSTVYSDVMTLDDTGRWRIKERVCHLDEGSYDYLLESGS